jgi:hypothetical protein
VALVNAWLRLFGRRSAADPDDGSGARDEAFRCLDERAQAAPAADAVALLAAEIPALMAFEPDLESRLARLDALATLTAAKLPEIERAIAAAALPLPSGLAASALAADNLLKIIAAEYQTVAGRLAADAPGSDRLPLAHATLYAARALVRRQWLAARAGKSASATAWRRLHRLYRLARQQGFAAHGDRDGTIESSYLAAILLALADPVRTPRQDLVPLLDAIERLSPLARLIETGGQEGGRPLIVDPLSHQPELAAADAGAGATWRIDLEPFYARLKFEIRLAERLAEEGARAPAGTPLRVLLRLLERMRRQPVRRFGRQSMAPRVDLVTGLEPIWWALSAPALSRRRAGMTAAPVTGEALEWSIVDESPDGFGLRQASGRRPSLTVGDLVGIGLRDVGRLHLCIVRRITEDARSRCRAGVQALAPEASALVVVTADLRRQLPVIRLDSLPAQQGRSAMVAAAGQLHAGTTLHVVGDPDGSTLRIGPLIEGNGRFELFLLDDRHDAAGSTSRTGRG